MKRILLVTNTLGNWEETNGVEYTYNNLIEHFRASDVPLDVITYGVSDDCREDGSVRIFTHKPRIPILVDAAPLWVDPSVQLSRLARRITEDRYSLVHIGTPDFLGIMATRVAKSCQYPLVNVYHTAVVDYVRIRASQRVTPLFGRLSGRTAFVYLRWLFNQSDLILAPSTSVQRELSGMYRPVVEVLGRGVDLERFNPGHRTRRDSEVQAVYVGRVAPEKNMDLLVDIFHSRPEIQLTIVGDGPFKEKMMHRIPRAQFTRKLTGLTLSRAFADADFFVFPSETDTFGNVVLQAMSSGLPVIVTDKMAPKEQVRHGIAGVVASNASEFGSAVEQLQGMKGCS